MNYEWFIASLLEAGYVQDKDRADALVKAVLGVLLSRIDDESTAEEVAQQLPEPLTLERLRGHQAGPTPVSAEEYFQVIADQFGISSDDAADAIQRVLHATREGLDEERERRLLEHMPSGWQALFTAA